MLIKRFLNFLIYIMLIFFPIQQSLLKYLKLPSFFRWIDEILLLLCFLITQVIFFVSFKISKKIFFLAIILTVFFLYGFLSGLYNNNNIIITFLGTLDYIKYFIFIPALAIFSFRIDELRKFYFLSLNLIVAFALSGLIIVICSWLNIHCPKFLGEVISRRFGFPRPAPFYMHPNALGLYCLLFFVLDFSESARISLKKIILLVGIILSISRMVYMAFVIGVVLILWLNKVRGRVLVTVTLGLIALMIIIPPIIEMSQAELLSENFYRGYVLKKSIEIWMDNAVLGTGPGTYGGVVSVEFESPIYRRYHFDKKWYNFGLRTFRSLDQFWPQVLVELGPGGLILFLLFLLVLMIMAKSNSNLLESPFARQMAKGLSIIPIIIFFYLFGSGLNLSFLGTYAILYGVMMGIEKEAGEAKSQNNRNNIS